MVAQWTCFCNFKWTMWNNEKVFSLFFLFSFFNCTYCFLKSWMEWWVPITCYNWWCLVLSIYDCLEIWQSNVNWNSGKWRREIIAMGYIQSCFWFGEKWKPCIPRESFWTGKVLTSSAVYTIFDSCSWPSSQYYINASVIMVISYRKFKKMRSRSKNIVLECKIKISSVLICQ